MEFLRRSEDLPRTAQEIIFVFVDGVLGEKTCEEKRENQDGNLA
jgi:hypothetical protein